MNRQLFIVSLFLFSFSVIAGCEPYHDKPSAAQLSEQVGKKTGLYATVCGQREATHQGSFRLHFSQETSTKVVTMHKLRNETWCGDLSLFHKLPQAYYILASDGRSDIVYDGLSNLTLTFVNMNGQVETQAIKPVDGKYILVISSFVVPTFLVQPHDGNGAPLLPTSTKP